MTLTLSGSANTITPVSAVQPAGSILQVLQVAKGDTFSSSATGSLTDITGLSQQITPASTSSRILIHFSLGGIYASESLLFSIKRDSTDVGIADADGNRLRFTTGTKPGVFGTAHRGTISHTYIDSPSSTSAITYKLQFINQAGDFYLNRNSSNGDDTNVYSARTASTFILMEVAG